MNDLQDEDIRCIDRVEEIEECINTMKHIESLNWNIDVDRHIEWNHKQRHTEHEAERKVVATGYPVPVVVEVALFDPEVLVFLP